MCLDFIKKVNKNINDFWEYLRNFIRKNPKQNNRIIIILDSVLPSFLISYFIKTNNISITISLFIYSLFFIYLGLHYSYIRTKYEFILVANKLNEINKIDFDKESEVNIKNKIMKITNIKNVTCEFALGHEIEKRYVRLINHTLFFLIQTILIRSNLNEVKALKKHINSISKYLEIYDYENLQDSCRKLSTYGKSVLEDWETFDKSKEKLNIKTETLVMAILGILAILVAILQYIKG